jgi:serine/threonine protein kinase
MATMFGRFEIQSEISKSETACIYKATDTSTNQTVALKTQNLAPLGERATAFVAALAAEGEAAHSLAGQNIVALYGAGEIDGQFSAAMEYIQGNSIATMIARKEGFSIWDLLDITRQVCTALETAAAAGVVHSSLEPAKIMVQWDGLVKILGYGISNMSLIEAEGGNGLGHLMPYCSPEQIRGEAIDQRSNLFTVGTILYEMVVGRKAFDAADPVLLVGQIDNEMPPEPAKLNPKIQPAVSALIMKALAKDPAERFQTARDLVQDLETCKDSGRKPAAEPKKTAATAVKVDPAARAAAASKFVSSGTGAAESAPAASRPAPARPVAAPVPVQAAPPISTHPVSTQSTSVPSTSTKPAPARAVAGSTEQTPTRNAAAAAAGSGAGFSSAGSSAGTSAASSAVKATSGARLIEDPEVDSQTNSHSSYSPSSAVLSAAIVEEEAAQSPGVAVDPMMSGAATTQKSVSFSDLDELPPLKEPVFETPAPEPEAPAGPVHQIYPRPGSAQAFSASAFSKKDDKPKIQPREVAEKAIQQIVTIPPRLMLFSILGAVAVILVVAISLFLRVRSEDDGSTAAPRPVKAVAAPQSVAPAPEATSVPVPAPPAEEAQPTLTVRQIQKRNAKNQRTLAPAPVPVVIPGQALIDSNPQGAQFQLDGKSDPSWVTPFIVPGLSPGKHIVSAIKSGYTTDTRSIDVVSGAKASLVFRLAPINALVVVTSTPPGAEITLDGRPTGRVTPSQFAVEKGSHTVIVKKQGFLDETTTADLGPGQNFQYAPALKALGNAEAMHTVGKFKKIFGGGGGDSTAGMGTVSIHTQPKGAQVVINQRILDKMSPVDVMTGPGNYVVDITLTGFKPIHKVISVEKGGKVAIDEVLERE